jgi:hypothetical protein
MKCSGGEKIFSVPTLVRRHTNLNAQKQLGKKKEDCFIFYIKKKTASKRGQSPNGWHAFAFFSDPGLTDCGKKNPRCAETTVVAVVVAVVVVVMSISSRCAREEKRF